MLIDQLSLGQFTPDPGLTAIGLVLNMPCMGNPLRRYRERAGLSQTALGALVNTTQQHIDRLEKMAFVPARWALLIAPHVACTPEDLTFPQPLIPVVGYVGAGDEVFPADQAVGGSGIDEIECPRGLDPSTTVAVIVRGDSMLPIADGWLLFYSGRDEPGSALIGELCVVQVADDGPTLVKQLRRGYSEGRFNLISTNAAPLEDIALEWAARVREIKPPGTHQSARDAA